MNYPAIKQPSPSIRKAAIFLASLDDAMAEQMLSEMPVADADAVRAVMLQLEDCGADEQQAVMAEFRRSQQITSPAMDSGVELDASLLAHIEQQTDALPQTVEHDPLARINEQEAAKIAETLSSEHPQTVALVISRLTHQTAASILPRLSISLQDEVLGRLAELDPADQSSVAVVESQLVAWVNEHRRKQQRLANGTELVQKLLENTPSGERQVIVGRIARENPRLARVLGASSESHMSAAYKAQFGNVAEVPAQPTVASLKRIMRPVERSPEVSVASSEDTDPLSVLEGLEDATLMAVLTEADRNVVTLALAGASEVLMKRILKRLPKAQAKQYRNQFRNIGPTRLSDMIAAQHQLAEYARHVLQNIEK